MGNRVVVTPSPVYPLVATDFYQVLDTSDVPPGVVNIVTGDREALAKTIAEHDDIAAYWYFGTKEGSATVEAGLDRQSQDDLGQPRPRRRLGERRRRPGPPLSPPRHAGEEHLGALRRIAVNLCVRNGPPSEMATPAGFEPATNSLEGYCSIP